MQFRRRLPLEDCLRLGASLADAPHVLHSSQLIHRDIKPANIIFVRGAPKLADIGLVTEAADAGGVPYLGTKGYIPRVKLLVTPKEYQMFHLHGMKGMPALDVAQRLQARRTEVYLAKYKVAALLKKHVRALERSAPTGR